MLNFMPMVYISVTILIHGNAVMSLNLLFSKKMFTLQT